MRFAIGIQIASIFIGWAAIQFPNFIRLADGTTLNIYNTKAPESTFQQLMIALIFGIILILPGFFTCFGFLKAEVILKLLKRL